MEARAGRERYDSAGDSIEGHIKRKRELLKRDSIEKEGGEAEIFKRSRKMVRSPGAKEMKEELKGMINEMREEIREELRDVIGEFRKVAEGQRNKNEDREDEGGFRE